MPNFEAILKAPKKEALDEKWFARFEQASNFESFELLENDPAFAKEQREKFLKGEIAVPGSRYPKIIEDRPQGQTEEERKKDKTIYLSEKLAQLTALKQEIIKNEKNEPVKNLYRWRINEKIAEIKMLRATKAGDMWAFQRFSNFIYGQPDQAVYQYNLHELHQTITESKASEDGHIQQAAAELSAYLPSASGESLPANPQFEKPSEETVAAARKQTETEFSGLLANLPIDTTKEELDADDMVKVLQAALDKLNPQVEEEDRWTVVKNPAGIALNASQGERKMKVPTTKTWPVKDVLGLIVHELGTHVVRRMAGARCSLKLLAKGLDRYEGGEEGVAKMREELTKGEIEEFAGLEGHLPISLAMGLAGKPYNFRQVFEVMEKVFTLRELRDGKSIEKAKEKGTDLAYKRCLRTFRGTDGQGGHAFTKDIIYREGNMDVWYVLGKNPDELFRLSVGKYDPANKRHTEALDMIMALTQAAITDKDLEDKEPGNV